MIAIDGESGMSHVLRGCRGDLQDEDACLSKLFTAPTMFEASGTISSQ